MLAAIGPWLGPALVERDVAIVDPLLVLPFLAEPFLAGELCGPVPRRRRGGALGALVGEMIWAPTATGANTAAVKVSATNRLDKRGIAWLQC
jgi:hypothetical protein